MHLRGDPLGWSVTSDTCRIAELGAVPAGRDIHYNLVRSETSWASPTQSVNHNTGRVWIRKEMHSGRESMIVLRWIHPVQDECLLCFFGELYFSLLVLHRNRY